MKIELRTLVLATAFILAASHLAVSAQSLPAAIDPTTGLPVPAVSAQSLPAAIDPTTGLPVTPAWKDADWPDPFTISNGNAVLIVLNNVNYDGLPISEVARQVRACFHDQFDVILPVNSVPPSSGNPQTDWSSYSVSLQLKNVTASELFNAMNMYFENNQVPVRWQLKMNGTRPTVLLQVINAPPLIAAPAPERHMVFFVGDLIGDDKTGSTNGMMSLSEITDAVKATWTAGAREPIKRGHLDIYAPAQLLIISGDSEQIDLAQQTLLALKQKAVFARSSTSENHGQSPETGPGSSGSTSK